MTAPTHANRFGSGLQRLIQRQVGLHQGGQLTLHLGLGVADHDRVVVHDLSALGDLRQFTEHVAGQRQALRVGRVGENHSARRDRAQ